MEKDAFELASYYDQVGRELFHKTAEEMADASTEYGVGKKVKGNFMGMVKKLMGRLKTKKGKIRPGYAKRRRG